MVGKDTAVKVEVSDRDLENAFQLLSALRTAARTSDALGLAYHTLTFKLSSTTLSATKLCQLCQDLENMSRGGTTMTTPAWVSPLEVEYERVEATLQAHQQRYQRYQG